MLQSKLLLNLNDYVYSQNLRKELHKSLLNRFQDLVENDLFKISTFLDPSFGIDAFELDKQHDIKKRVKFYLNLESPLNVAINESVAESPLSKKRKENYIFFRDTQTNSLKYDDHDLIIDEYARLIRSNEYLDSLLFWKCHQVKFPTLAKLALKFLGVPASSASVERMFSIAGHIFSNKRRRCSARVFENLVFLKLNENFL
jgi:hypothetical protein